MNLELFITVMVTILSVFITENLIDKREKRYHKEELMLKCLQEHIKWLNDIYPQILLYSRMIEDCLCKSYPNDRLDRFNEITENYNILIEKILSYIDSHMFLNMTIEGDLNIQAFGKAVNKELNGLFLMFNDFIKKPDTKEALDINNMYIKKIDNLFDSQYKVLNNKINNCLM